jgi:hypothetical protein
MTVKELYDYITSKMTPEEALIKLLEGANSQYEKLKFDAEGVPVHPLLVATMAAMDMGWDIAVKGEEDNDVIGLVMGTEEYMKEIFPEKE